MKWWLFFPLFAAVNLVQADDNVHGYYRKDGKYVQFYKRPHSDGWRYNDYSSEDRKNPYTGKKGTQRNEMSKKPARNKKSY